MDGDLPYRFDVVWSDVHQAWVVREERLRLVGDKIILFDTSEKEAKEVCHEANIHRYRGSVRYYGWIEPHRDEIEEVIRSAVLKMPHRADNIRRAILKACESFGSANAGLSPKLRVVEALAHQVLPAFEAILQEVKVEESWKGSLPTANDWLTCRNYKRDFDDGVLARLWQERINRRMEEVCDAARLVPSNRWWIQDMLCAYQENMKDFASL